jgi:hypothetical protein
MVPGSMPHLLFAHVRYMCAHTLRPTVVHDTCNHLVRVCGTEHDANMTVHDRATMIMHLQLGFDMQHGVVSVLTTLRTLIHMHCVCPPMSKH